MPVIFNDLNIKHSSSDGLTIDSQVGGWYTNEAPVGKPVAGRKVYWEIEINSTGNIIIGMTPSRYVSLVANSIPGYAGQGFAFQNQATYYINGGTNALSPFTYTTGDVIGFAYDVDGAKLWISKNGTWVDGDPETDTSPSVHSITTGVCWPFVTLGGIVNVTGGFVAGNFTYSIPTGFTALDLEEAPAGTLWTPAEIDTELWLDADDADTFTIDTGVSQWDDKSGNNRHATQSNGPSQPVVNTAGLNTKDTLKFVSTGDYFDLPDLTALNSGSAMVFIVVRTDLDVPLATNSGLWHLTNSVETYPDTHFSFSDGTLYDSAGTTLRKTAGNPTTVLSYPNIYCVVTEPNNWTNFFNDVQFYNSTSNTVGFGSTQYLGRGAGSYYLNGNVAEVIIVSTVDNDLRNKIAGYLAHKWNLAFRLDDVHPYKSEPPYSAAGGGSSDGSFSGGSTPPPITYEVLRKIVEMPYSLNQVLRKIVEMLYSSKIAKIIEFMYGDMPQYKKLIDMPYGDYRKLIKIINLKYGDNSELRVLVEFVYSLRGKLRSIKNMPYGIMEQELRKIIEQNYDLSLYDELRKIIDSPYAIATDEPIDESTTISVVSSDGIVFDPHHINIEVDEELYHIAFEMHNMLPEDYENAVPLPLAETFLNVTINSTVYYFVIEERNIREGKSETSYTIKGASPTILLDLPYASTFSEELSGLASDIVQYLIDKEVDYITVDWQMIDWYIPPGKLNVVDKTPMQVIEDIVIAGGGIRQSAPDGSLICRALYPVNIPDYETYTPQQYYTDLDNFYYVDQNTVNKEGYNNFFIGDQEASADGLTIESKSISATEADVRVFQVPFNDDIINLRTSGGSWVVIQNLGTTSEEITEELIEIIDGQGNTRYPIYSIPDQNNPDYRETDLGPITFSEEGVITCQGNENSLIMLSYTTKYYKYKVTDPNIETVQFYPEIM